MKPREIQQIINKIRYNTATAQLLCGDDWWDGHNHERGGTQTFLYRAPRSGRYFFLRLSCWQGDCPEYIEPASQSEAVEFYELCAARGEARVGFEEAFPGIVIEEA